ncbi:hypothetical protein GXW82_07835 [Streptacidiphilus sp. 4-A2]|nr:hypothetical protein [Streptacidiphilus sp. 4-A2]
MRGGWFDLVVLDTGNPVAGQAALSTAVTGGGHYQLLDQIPYQAASGTTQDYLVYQLQPRSPAPRPSARLPGAPRRPAPGSGRTTRPRRSPDGRPPATALRVHRPRL